MSNALKCNKCSVCFDPENVEGFFVSLRDIVVRDSEKYKETKMDYAVKGYDLCPSCSKEFLAWSKIDKQIEKAKDADKLIQKALVPPPDQSTDLLKKMRGIASSLWR